MHCNASIASPEGSSSTSSSGLLPIIKCPNCSIEVKRLVSKTDRNPGRVFYKCENNKKDGTSNCKFFLWEDAMRSEGQFGRSDVVSIVARLNDEMTELKKHDRSDVVSIVARLNDEMAELKKHNSLLIEGLIKVTASNEKLQILVALNLLVVICVLLVLIWK